VSEDGRSLTSNSISSQLQKAREKCSQTCERVLLPTQTSDAGYLSVEFFAARVRVAARDTAGRSAADGLADTQNKVKQYAIAAFRDIIEKIEKIPYQLLA
jgi:hypothetical protein